MAEPAGTTIFARLAALSDPVRCRLLLLLERQELTVSEVCQVLQLPQSTASRHLKLLADDGWVAARREGTSRRYSAVSNGLDPSARRLWRVIREQVASSPAADQDRRRLEGVLAERRTRSQEFFSTAAGEWAELRREMFGARFDLHGLLGLLDPDWVTGDLGCGTGQTSEALAPFVGRVIAVDDSQSMLDAAARRLHDATNVELRRGQLESLPLEDSELDAALMMLVLHHVGDPERALAEAARVLKPGGRLLLIDMLPHEREEYRQRMGHVWLGFSAEQLEAWLTAAGLERPRIHPLPADPQAKGPTLFAATAAKPETARAAAGRTQKRNGRRP